ncbi:BgTH12-01415 [Blumeria graminis f. sp. triticale]|uniref:BgTH12-01415 n=1 Tax=Blumeria graminis f. sp. triticale TaxID=1689686 RepID=A0A9W4DJZ6_BLUGR|nr:BgTH12-01415 [Blumeria graminis f. sp. triticale]
MTQPVPRTGPSQCSQIETRRTRIHTSTIVPFVLH